MGQARDNLQLLAAAYQTSYQELLAVEDVLSAAQDDRRQVIGGLIEAAAASRQTTGAFPGDMDELSHCYRRVAQYARPAASDYLDPDTHDLARLICKLILAVQLEVRRQTQARPLRAR